jgi:prolyl 4-hydroxylase
VIAAAEPLVERSGVIDSKTGAPAFDPIRTSYGAFLPIGYDEVISRIEQRAAEWTMIPVGHQ